MDFFRLIKQRPLLSSVICIIFWIMVITGSLIALLTQSESNTQSGYYTPDHLESAQGADYLNNYMSVNSSFSLIIHSKNDSLLTTEAKQLVSRIKNDVMDNEFLFRALSIDEPIMDVFSLSEDVLREYFISVWYLSQTIRGSALSITGAASVWSDAFWSNYQETNNSTIAIANASSVAQEIINNKLTEENLPHYTSVMENTILSLETNWTSWFSSNSSEVNVSMVNNLTYDFLKNWNVSELLDDTLSISEVASSTVEQLPLAASSWEEENSTIELAAFQSFGTIDDSAIFWVRRIYNSTQGLSSLNAIINDSLLGILNGSIILPGKASSLMTYFLNRLVSYDLELEAYNTLILHIQFQVDRSSEVGNKAFEQIILLLDLWRENNQEFDFYLTSFDLLLWEEEVQIVKDSLLIDILVVSAILLTIILVKRNITYALFSLSLAIVALVVGRAAYLFLLPESIGKTNEALILMTVITLAAAVDSNIFLFSRFQEERIKKSKGKALVSTFKNTLPSVFTSLIAILSSFSIFAFSSFAIFYSASIAVSIGLLVNMIEILTLTPCIIWLFGDKITFSKNQRKNSKRNKNGDLVIEAIDENSEGIISKTITNGARWATNSPHTVMTIFLAITFLSGLVIMLFPVTYNNVYLAPDSYESSQGYSFVEDEIGYSYLSKFYITIVLPQEDFLMKEGEINWKTYNILANFTSSLAEFEHVTAVLSPTTINQVDLAGLLNSSSYLERASANVFMDMTIANNSGLCIIELSMDKPDMSDEMLDKVEEIRQFRDDFIKNNPCEGWKILLTGASGLLYDVKTELLSEIVK
ncbi:MAG: MMPL family transporter, partial [Candidatus Kariarchaeaceae archaeon]